MINKDAIIKALKRLEGAEIKVIIRGGEIVKIPAQQVKYPEKDGIIDLKEIPADITE